MGNSGVGRVLRVPGVVRVLGDGEFGGWKGFEGG